MPTRLLQQIREAHGKTQDDLARAGQEAGLAWTRATVADLEHGRRRLDLSDFRHLPAVLLYLTGRTYTVTLTAEVDRWSLVADSAAEPARGLGRDRTAFPHRTITVSRQRIGDAEKKAARRLGTSPESVVEVAPARWGRSLTEERERQVAAQAAPDATPRTRQALRGRVSRELVAELASSAQPERARERARRQPSQAVSSPRQRRAQTKTR